MTISLGLDLSLTGAGIVITEKPQGSKVVNTLLAEQVPVSKAADLGRWDRIQSVADYIANAVDLHDPDVIVIEGYGQASHRGVQSFIKLVEVGSLVRSHLHRNSRQWSEVPPPSLKLFATGKGKYPSRALGKKAMIRGVMENWGFVTKNDNIADAFGLSMFGLGLAAVIVLKDHQLTALDGVKHGVQSDPVQARRGARSRPKS